VDSTDKPRSSGHSFLPKGLRLGTRYLIESIIGEGASGVVYLARRSPEGDRVALKVIHRHLCTDEEVFGRFRREAGILKRIQGQHVVQVYELFEETGLLIIALEHIDGTSLEEAIKASPPDLDQAVEISLQVCAALGAAHAAGVIHRDLKPSNVLIQRVTGKSTGLRVRVVDFGLAKVVQGDGPGQPPNFITQRDMIFGTPEYMAPEQARGDEVDLRADLYAAGVMLYEMVVGHVPFHGRTPISTMDAHLHEGVPHPRTSRSGHPVAPSLAAVILRALAKEPGDRYPSARAFAEALTAAWGERLVISPRDSAQGAVSADELAMIDTELNLGEDARAAVKAAEEMLASQKAASDLSTAKTMVGDLSTAKTIAGELSTAKTIAGELSTAKTIAGGSLGSLNVLPKTLPMDAPSMTSKTLPEAGISNAPDAIGTTLRSAVPGKLSETGPRGRVTPEILIQAPPPGSNRWLWVAIVIAAALCVLIGVWMGVR
jgi:serine/threonine-protein kinase